MRPFTSRGLARKWWLKVGRPSCSVLVHSKFGYPDSRLTFDAPVVLDDDDPFLAGLSI